MSFLTPRVLTATIAETGVPIPLGEAAIHLHGVLLIAEKEPGIPNSAEVVVQTSDNQGNFADALTMTPGDERKWQSSAGIKASSFKIRGTAGDAVRAVYADF